MDEDRLVTLMLWIGLVVGAACFMLVYFATSDRLTVGLPISSTNQTDFEMSDRPGEQFPSSPVPGSGNAVELSAHSLKKKTTVSSLPLQH